METNGDVVLVTGGSGFVGQHVIKILQEQGSDVKEIRVFDKNPYVNKLGHAEYRPLKVIVGDIRSSSDVHEALCGVDTVIHTAGVVSFGTFPDFDAMEQVNVGGTANIIDGCIAQNVPRLIFTSTIDVVIGYDEIIDGDESQPVPRDFLFPGYPDTKNRAERMVISANHMALAKGGGSRLHTLSLRPNVMYGEGDPYFIPNALRSAKNSCGILPRIGNGKALFQQAYVGNTAWAHLVAMRALRSTPHVSGRCFFIPDDTPVCNSFTFLEPFLTGRGYRLASWSIPYSVVYGMMYTAETVLKLMAPLWKINIDTPLCSIIYINKSYYFNRKGAQEMLGFTPLYSYRDSLENSLRYYNELEL